MVKAVSHVFMHLKTHELLAASRVCIGWNIIAMQKSMVSYKKKLLLILFNINLIYIFPVENYAFEKFYGF